MTELMEKAIAAIEKLPKERQDEIAEVILLEASDTMVLSYQEKAAILEGSQDTKKGIFAPDEAIANHLARLRSV